MKRSVSAKDQLEEVSNEHCPTILFQRIFLGSLLPLKFSNTIHYDVVVHKYYYYYFHYSSIIKLK